MMFEILTDAIDYVNGLRKDNAGKMSVPVISTLAMEDFHNDDTTLSFIFYGLDKGRLNIKHALSVNTEYVKSLKVKINFGDIILVDFPYGEHERFYYVYEWYESK
jgi:hypothetical protein